VTEELGQMQGFNKMVLPIQRGKGFEQAVAWGVADTPANRASFEILVREVAEAEKKGYGIEVPFD
jgi:hypothetical protein